LVQPAASSLHRIPGLGSASLQNVEEMVRKLHRILRWGNCPEDFTLLWSFMID
jgi:hypothetical protein